MHCLAVFVAAFLLPLLHFPSPPCMAQPSPSLLIKVGIEIPRSDSDYGLRRKNSAFGNAIGAIPMALERLRQEQALPNNLNFTFVWHFERCRGATAAGLAYELVDQDVADVLIATPCMDAPPVIGLMGAYFNLPTLIYGVSMRSVLTDKSLYPTLLSAVPNFRDFARTICQLMNHFQWETFAFIQQTDPRGQCAWLSKDIDTAANENMDCSIGFKGSFMRDQPTAQTNFLITQIKSRARIVLLCFDDIIQLRLFSLAMFDAGMASDDYVFLVPDHDLTIAADTNKRPFWLQDRGNTTFEMAPEVPAPPDGRDGDAAQIGRRTLFLHLDMANWTGTAAVDFSRSVLDHVHNWPFFCADCNDTQASIYAPFLFDVFYAYGLALAKTVKQAGNQATQFYRNGTLLAKNGQAEFEGITGRVRIGADGIRQPIYVLSTRVGLVDQQSSSVLRPLVQFTVTSQTVEASLRVNGSAAVWASRGGVQPLAVPVCGFDGNGCPQSTFEQYKAIFVTAIVLGCLLSMAAILLPLLIVRSKREERRRLDQLWQIAAIQLKRIHAKKPSQGRSQHSVRTLATTVHKSLSSLASSNIESEWVAQSSSLYLLNNGEKCVGRRFAVAADWQLAEADKAQLRQMRTIDQPNLNRFVGLCLDSHRHKLALWRFCARGSIRDLVAHQRLNRDAVFVHSMLRDLAEGLQFLHSCPLQIHGNLRDSNCLVTERWQVQLSDFGLPAQRWDQQKARTKELLWKAPELLREADKRGTNPLAESSRPGDVYSLALVFAEVLNMLPCWEEAEEEDEEEVENDGIADANVPEEEQPGRRRRSQRRSGGRNAQELLYLIKKGGLFPPRPRLRPAIENSALVLLVRDCWAEEAAERPRADQLLRRLRSTHSGDSNLMDHIFGLLEEHAGRLEEEVEERTRELVEEKKKSDQLLYRMLPKNAADRLKAGQTVAPEHFDCVTVFFSDVVGFTQLAAPLRPLQVVELVNDLYTAFDAIIARHDVYKVETIGDGYLCVSGLPKRNGDEHAREIAEMALHFLAHLQALRLPQLRSGSQRVQLRIGAHSGPCVAGIVGLAMPRFCLFGDTVNTAARMESSSMADRIHISGTTHQILATKIGGYETRSRGEVIIKGKGVMETFWLLGRSNIGNGNGDGQQQQNNEQKEEANGA